MSPPCVHQQRAGNHRLHVVHHASRVSCKRMTRNLRGGRRRGRCVDRNHQARRGSAGGHHSQIYSQAGHDDGVRRGHVHVPRDGPAAAHFRPAAGGNRRADHRRGIAVLANVPITKWRIPPFLVAWLVPLAIGLSVGYIHPVVERFFAAASLRAHSGPVRRRWAWRFPIFR